MQIGKTWEEVSGSATGDVEAKNLERFVEQARSSNARYTVSIFDSSGARIPVSEWSQHLGRGLNVHLQFDGSQDVVRWVPIDPSNIAILLRE